jgi:shikimate dehydrogenase
MIRGTTRLAAVIGWPVEHSRSPQMFEAAFAATKLDAVMVPIGVAPESFDQILRALRVMNAIGASVTIPHKLAAAQLCDELSIAAREIGAVNCIHVDDDRLVGHNTDCYGFTDALITAGFEPAGKRCVILGSGGAARAVAYGLRVEHASSVDVIARRPQQVNWISAHTWTPLELRSYFARADLIVDATSSGLADGELAMVNSLPLDALRPTAWVATLVYHRRTALIERCASRGHSVVDGRGMLVHQGARAFAIWTGTTPPIHAMQRALDVAILGT